MITIRATKDLQGIRLFNLGCIKMVLEDWEKESGRKALSCENKPDSIKQVQDIENESLNELYKQKENE